MNIDFTVIGLLGRVVVINVVPFFVVFHLVIRRRKQFISNKFGEARLLANEIQTVGLSGYFVILSIYFFSIPVINYLNTQPGYEILLIEPDGYTVFMIAFISFWLVVAGVFLKYKKMWAHKLAIFIISLLMFYSFFSILELGIIAVVPVTVFLYLLYRLTRNTLKEEIFNTIA